MDLGTAIVTLAVGAIAVLPRVPALSGIGRRQARIQRDIELWADMPHGEMRDRLGSDIERQTGELLEERNRDRTVENAWLYGSALLALAWAFLVASTAITGDGPWVDDVRSALGLAGLAMGVVGAIFLAASASLLAWKGGRRATTWIGAHVLRWRPRAARATMTGVRDEGRN